MIPFALGITCGVVLVVVSIWLVERLGLAGLLLGVALGVILTWLLDRV